MNHFLRLVDLDIKNKKVFLRVDYNVPIHRGNILNDDRIRLTLPTLEYMLKQGVSRIIIASHLDDPYKELEQGKSWDQIKREFSLKPVAQRLSKLLNQKVAFVRDYGRVKEVKEKLILLENVRFFREEMRDDKAFAKSLASMADVYVNDAFGVAHRKHASVCAITLFLPSAAGFLMEKEVKYLGKALETREKPFVAILGGAKVSDKIKLIENLRHKVDALLIGGAMAFGFYKAQGKEVGKSLCEGTDYAKKLVHDPKIILPMDIVVAEESNGRFHGIKTVAWDKIPKNAKGLDIGEKTRQRYASIIKDAKTIVWNGPMGLFEAKPFDEGTKAIAHALATSNATTVVGGGDSVAALEELGLVATMTHVSTGGGASLKFLEGDHLPAIMALEEAYKRFKK